MKKILFVHQNFPAQFKNIADHLYGEGYEISAVISSLNTNNQNAKYRIIRYDIHRSSKIEYDLLSDFEAKVIRAEAVYLCCKDYAAGGFKPDIIYFHPGWGESTFLKALWPSAKLLMYCEYFTGEHNEDLFYGNNDAHVLDEKSLLKIVIKKSNLLLNLANFDLGISPTLFQKKTFPKEYQRKIETIHDGVDTSYFSPSDQVEICINRDKRTYTFDKDSEVLTFVNRNMEPYRGINSMVRAIPSLLQLRPNLSIFLIGEPGKGYGPAPDGGKYGAKNWREIILEEIDPQMRPDDWERVFFLGTVPKNFYRSCLQLSSCHVYLTYPYILSWSLLEAMSMGCSIVASDNAAVREFIEDDINGTIVDFFDVPGLVRACVNTLTDRVHSQEFGILARRKIVAEYDLESIILPKLSRILREI